MKQSLVNYFKGKKYPGDKNVSIYSILNAIKSNKFKEQIECGRSYYRTGDFESYQVLKGGLIAITFSGTFHPTRNSINIQNYSGYIILDLDHCGSSLKQYKAALMADKYVHSVWISPSGDGLKFLIKTGLSAENHKNVYRSAVKYFNDCYKLNIDTTGSDIARLCYVSHDSDLYINQNAELYNDELPEEFTIRTKSKNHEGCSLGEVVLHLDKKNFKNNVFNKKRLKRIYFFLKKRDLSITSAYEDWVRVAFAISNSFNYDFGYKWFLEFSELDNYSYDEYESIKLINQCYSTGLSKSSFGTIVYLAQKQGYKV